MLHTSLLSAETSPSGAVSRMSCRHSVFSRANTAGRESSPAPTEDGRDTGSTWASRATVRTETLWWHTLRDGVLQEESERVAILTVNHAEISSQKSSGRSVCAMSDRTSQNCSCLWERSNVDDVHVLPWVWVKRQRQSLRWHDTMSCAGVNFNLLLFNWIFLYTRFFYFAQNVFSCDFFFLSVFSHLWRAMLSANLQNRTCLIVFPMYLSYPGLGVQWNATRWNDSY